MTRRDKLLNPINQRGRGIEIGPSHNPIASKREGFNVVVIDTLDQNGLREKYAPHGIDLSLIEPVDFVWNGERYSDLVGQTEAFDWIIGSHVIEHVPDLIAFLNSCAEVLKNDGVLTLAIPDKRRCFDHFRPTTGLAKVIDTHLAQHRQHTPGNIAEFMLNAVSARGRIAWGANESGEWRRLCAEPDVVSHFHKARSEQWSMDVHGWCFTPTSFRLLIRDLHLLGLTPFLEASWSPTDGHEFFVALSKTAPGTGEDRLTLMQRALDEERDRA